MKREELIKILNDNLEEGFLCGDWDPLQIEGAINDTADAILALEQKGKSDVFPDIIEIRAVENIPSLAEYKQWTKVSRLLAVGLQGIEMREVQQKEQPQPERSNLKTAEEYVIKTWGKEWLDHDWESGDVIDALCEYRSQGLPEVTDEMIEREFPTQIENINKADSENLSFLQIIQRNRFRQQGVMWTRKQFTGK